MPRIDGMELLEWISGWTGCATLKVVTLTTSGEARDLERARSSTPAVIC